jgi:hypothetical protein
MLKDFCPCPKCLNCCCGSKDCVNAEEGICDCEDFEVKSLGGASLDSSEESNMSNKNKDYEPKRSKEIEAFIKNFKKAAFGETSEGHCVSCKAKVEGRKDFKDEISYKEWHLSNLCQKCQDEVFSEPEDWD